MAALCRGERENLVDQIRGQINDKRVYAQLRMLREMCRGEAYGVSSLGSERDAEKLGPKKLYQRYTELLSAARLELFYCGSAEIARLEQALLSAFSTLPRAELAEEPPVLPGRDLTLYDAAVASRGWEQKRLRQLYGLASGATRLQLTSLEALSLRTMPREVLFAASVTLRPGAAWDLKDLTARLEAAGYARTSLVEGPGQFALRGGILDVYSPAYDQPVRAEFFGDEVDTMAIK